MEILENIIEKTKKKVSYSQFCKWFTCPNRFRLDYVLGLKEFEDNLNTAFGTSIHETIQLYIKTLYDQGTKEADSINMTEKFKDVFDRELSNKKINHTQDDYMGFLSDGENIILSFKNVTNRMKNFPPGKYECVSVEDEIIIPIKNNVEFIAYIDIILKDKFTGRYKILDLKTSTLGWNKYAQENKAKIYQILLYKSLFSKKYNIPLDLIDIEFFILKRKLYENVNYPQTRIQILRPKNGSKQIIESLNWFIEFVNSCFLSSGEFNTDEKNYPKVPGERKKNCKYCPHYKKTCDGKETK